MLGIREVADLKRAILIAYRHNSAESARAMVGEYFDVIKLGELFYAPHPQTFLATMRKFLVEYLALSAAQERQEKPRKEYFLSKKKQGEDVVCLVMEGPQTFASLEPVPWSYIALFGQSDLRDCYLAWECSTPDGVEPERVIDGETTLIVATEGRGAFYAPELTYDKNGWVKGCVIYLVLISFNLAEDPTLQQQKLVYTLRQKKTYAKNNPFACEPLMPGTLPLDVRWQAVIQRAQDGYLRCCAPYPREKDAVFREFVLQETFTRQDQDTHSDWMVVRDLPLRDKIEYFRQFVLNRRRRAKGTSSYRKHIGSMHVLDALATVWEPWQLMAFVQEKLGTVEAYSVAIKRLLYCPECGPNHTSHNAWKHAWSLARAKRILSFGSFVEAHLPDDWK